MIADAKYIGISVEFIDHKGLKQDGSIVVRITHHYLGSYTCLAYLGSTPLTPRSEARER
jgi:hypothetical protein